MTPKVNPIHKWCTPVCNECKNELSPWVDWVAHGSVGYCTKCNSFLLVKSKWTPVTGFHSREEIDELENHEVKQVLGEVINNQFSKYMWGLHQTIPISANDASKLYEFINLIDSEAEQHQLLKHIVWSLIWNSQNNSTKELVEYLHFVFHCPHYVTIGGVEVWIGHELNLVTRLEELFGSAVLDVVYEIYLNSQITVREFGDKIGFYIPTSNKLLERFDTDFQEYAKKARSRFAI